jgi:hypothetical protein
VDALPALIHQPAEEKLLLQRRKGVCNFSLDIFGRYTYDLES